MPSLPVHPDTGETLAALQVSVNPPRFVYANVHVLAWLKEELLQRKSTGMPADDYQPRWA